MNSVTWMVDQHTTNYLYFCDTSFAAILHLSRTLLLLVHRQMPSTVEEWLVKEKGFARKFPHCIGAIDGKHIVIESPVHSGSEYYNYKRSFSIVLLALVDSDYCFMFADIGSHGRISDGGIFRNSFFGKTYALAVSICHILVSYQDLTMKIYLMYSYCVKRTCDETLFRKP